LVGSNITDSILRTANGSNHKSIDEFILYKVMKMAIDCTDQPSMSDVLEQLIEVINHTIDFCMKVCINIELMQLNATQMTTYGIVIGIPQLTLMLLANINTATKSYYGCNFCLAMHAIRKKYTYNHVHDAALLQIILKELAGTNNAWVLKDALALSAGTVHLVAKSVSYLQVMMNKDTDSAYTKSAYGTNSDSDSSEKERKPRGHDRKKSHRSKSRNGCRRQKKDKDNDPKKNMCP
jgi:hypothetical protein